MGKQLLNKNISPRVTRASLLLKNCEKLPHRRHYKAHGSNYENAVTGHRLSRVSLWCGLCPLGLFRYYFVIVTLRLATYSS